MVVSLSQSDLQSSFSSSLSPSPPEVANFIPEVGVGK
jgi:hypothetical protein